MEQLQHEHLLAQQAAGSRLDNALERASSEKAALAADKDAAFEKKIAEYEALLAKDRANFERETAIKNNLHERIVDEKNNTIQELKQKIETLENEFKEEQECNRQERQRLLCERDSRAKERMSIFSIFCARFI